MPARLRALTVACVCLSATAPAFAQTASRIALLKAEDRRAASINDLAILRLGIHSADGSNALIAVRALGRLERPALIADLLPMLRSSLPEIRAEAANAIGQAAEGWKGKPPAGAVDPIERTLEARLDTESVPTVRASIYATLGRLPYTTPEQAEHVEARMIAEFADKDSTAERLALAEGIETFVRRQKALRPPGDDLVAALVDLSTLRSSEATSGARIRRLALEALIGAEAADDATIRRCAGDPDPQVRRLAMKAAATKTPAHDESIAALLIAGLADQSAIVRLEAARWVRATLADAACPFLIGASKDRETQVSLVAIDQLAGCGGLADAVALLGSTVDDLSGAGQPRAWHRAAHAIVALAAAAPDHAGAALPQFVASNVWQLRMYSARAAVVLKNQPILEKLAADADDNVREAAIDGLVQIAGHGADKIYVAALGRGGHQVLRAAAIALTGSPSPDDAIPALKSALQALIEEGTDNGTDPREAITAALVSLGVPAPKTAKTAPVHPVDFDADDLKRLASPRARITIRGVGSFDLALFTREAPATVLRFAKLAESGYYNGLTFHRIVPNAVIQGGSPGANEYVGDDWFMRDELGLWPHVRGAVGISTRGRDTGDAQIFIDTVDNPRYDHNYTVFGQVLNGIELVDLILEGDVIDTIEIIP